jgi:HAD superfamily 5'-nucleotidase-like hydrolase
MSDEIALLPLPPPSRRVFCNRTLNMRSIKAVGFDMDYTLVHYRIERWEQRAYEQAKAKLLELGWPVGDLSFDSRLTEQGLVVDTEEGNLVKANRFGYVKQASHGTRMLDFDEQRRVYGRDTVDLDSARWEFMNTYFSLSRACLFLQAVDLRDEGKLPGDPRYSEIYRTVDAAVDEVHFLGRLKAEIASDPASYVELDPELPLALLDLRHSGKKLLLITNSGWFFTQSMMSYALDRYLPAGSSWRDLFDLVIVSSRKPDFFTHRNPIFEVVGEDGMLRPVAGPLRDGTVYLGGDAHTVETHLGLSGAEILYVGDHIYTDVTVSKTLLRWRTALVLRDLEQEIEALEAFKPSQARLAALMEDKERLEHTACLLRLRLRRTEEGYGPAPEGSPGQVHQRLQAIKARLIALDDEIAPLARAASTLRHPRWGLTMRAGNDKSHLARQIEAHADIYTSRVSNLALCTPFVFLRSPRGSLPHDGGPDGGVSA